MSRRSRFSMINPTDGPRVGAWRRAALGFCLAAALSATGVTAAQAATLEGQQFDDTVVLGQHKLQLNGLGLRGVAWLKAFVAGLYVTTPSRDAAALLAETGPLFAQQLDGLGQLMPGDVVDMDYLPGKGLVLSRNGKAAGKPVVGDDLYRAVLQIFVGEHAIDPRMKQGLLGAPA